MVDKLVLCNRRSYYTYAEMFAPAGFAFNSRSSPSGLNGQALTPC